MIKQRQEQDADKARVQQSPHRPTRCPQRRRGGAVVARLPRAGGEPDEECSEREREGGSTRARGIGHDVEEEDLVGQRDEATRGREHQYEWESQQRLRGIGYRLCLVPRQHVAVITPIGDNGARGDGRIDRDGGIHRTLHAGERKQ